MKKGWLLAFLSVVVLGGVLVFGAASGAAITYFLTRTDVVKSALAAPADVDPDSGVLVSAVKPDSPADEAGLVRGDILQALDGQPVDTFPELRAALADREPGDTVELTVLHGDEIHTLEATLAERDGAAYLGLNPCGSPRGDIFGAPLTGPVTVDAVGAEIVEVVPDGPADQAGLQVGEVIVSVDGETLTLENDLGDRIRAYLPGDKVVLGVRSGGETEPRDVEITLGENPDQAGQAWLGIGYRPSIGGEFWFGVPSQGDENSPFNVTPMLPQEGMPFYLTPPFQQLPEGVEQAIIVGEVLPDTPAAASDIQAGDLITALDGKPVGSPKDFVEAVQSHKPGDEITLTLYRDGEEMQVTVALAEHPEVAGAAYLGVKISGIVKMKQFQQSPDSHPSGELPGLPGGDA